MGHDLPTYLTHTTWRNIPWKGHAAFPRKVVAIRTDNVNRHSRWYADLRIFKWDLMHKCYKLMTEDQIEVENGE